MNALAQRQQFHQGVALITAILIVALASIAATAMHSKQQLNLRRTENLLHADQAYMYALAVEETAAQLLLMDKDMKVDHPSDDWAIPPTQHDNAMISGAVIDPTAGFPINNLVDDAGLLSPYYFKAFGFLTDRLFENNTGVNNLVVDWLDKDTEVTRKGGTGAEDTDYQNLERRPFRTPNGPISSISELQLMLRLSEDAANLHNDYAALFPSGEPALVNALPRGAKININSAPHVILSSLLMAVKDVDDQMADEVVSEALKDRDKEPLKDSNGLKQELDTKLRAKLKNVGNSANPNGNLTADHTKDIKAVMDMLDVGSKYYMVQSNVALGRIEMQLYSLLKREQNKVTTLRRGIGAL